MFEGTYIQVGLDGFFCGSVRRSTVNFSCHWALPVVLSYSVLADLEVQQQKSWIMRKK